MKTDRLIAETSAYSRARKKVHQLNDREICLDSSWFFNCGTSRQLKIIRKQIKVDAEEKRR